MDSMNETTKKRVTFDLPEDDVLPSHPSKDQLERMAPEIREIFEALEDEAYVEDGLGEEFFSALNLNEIPEEVKSEYGIKDMNEPKEEWFNEFEKFKSQNQLESDEDEQVDDYEDTVSDDSRGNGAQSVMTGFSMTSSVLYRNEHLTTLDDRFERLMNLEYIDEEIGELEEDDPEFQTEISDERLNDILDDFLDHKEIKGKRLVPKVEATKQLDSLREELYDGLDKQSERERIYRIIEKDESDDEQIKRPEMKEREMWDCETILSTYSNIYNRPKIIDATKPRNRIFLNKKGMPVTVPMNAPFEPVSEDEEEEEEMPGTI